MDTNTKANIRLVQETPLIHAHDNNNILLLALLLECPGLRTYTYLLHWICKPVLTSEQQTGLSHGI